MDQRLDQPEGAPRAAGDVVEESLASALAGAAAAGQWGAVASLARELESRRVARAGAHVIDLETRRRGR